MMRADLSLFYHVFVAAALEIPWASSCAKV